MGEKPFNPATYQVEVYQPPLPSPEAALTYADIPRYIKNSDDTLPQELLPMAEVIMRMTKQGASWAGIAGRLGMSPDELRKLTMEFPGLARAAQFGLGVGSDEMTQKLYSKAIDEGDMGALTLWLKTRGGFVEQKQSAHVSMQAGDVKVSIDLDRLRDMASEQTNMIDNAFDGSDS